MENRVFDIEDRLIAFGVQVIQTATKLPGDFAGRHMAGQMTRSGTAPALIYGEAHGAESRADFIHKMKLGLKELRETFVNLKFSRHLKWISEEELQLVIEENNQLIAIFVTSIKTAKSNNNKK